MRKHPFTRKDYFEMWLNAFAPSSVDVLLYAFHEVPDWSTELRERQRLMLDIMRLARAMGVEFAFPTQTVQLHQAAPEAAAAASVATITVDEAHARGRAEASALLEASGVTRERPGTVRLSVDQLLDRGDGGE